MPVSHARSSVLTSTDEQVPGLLEVLAQVADPRRRRGRRFGLVFLLAVAVVSVLAGSASFREIGDMQQFIQRMDMAFIATSDGSGQCDCSFRAGTAGFIRVLDSHAIAYPEYRGNGVMASLGNMLQNPHIGILLADFTHDLIGLHINGDASIVTPARMQEFDLDIPESGHSGRQPVQWGLVHVTEAFIHCSKHIPRQMRGS